MEYMNTSENCNNYSIHSTMDQIFGYLGSSLLIISMIPQLYKTYKTRCIEDISSLFLAIQVFTSSILMVYSVLIYSIPLIYGNTGILFELLFLSFAKWKFKNRSKHIEHNLEEAQHKFGRYIEISEDKYTQQKLKKRVSTNTSKISRAYSDSDISYNETSTVDNYVFPELIIETKV